MGRRATLNQKKRNRRLIFIGVIVIVVALVGALAYAIYVSSMDPGSKYIGLPVSSSVMSDLTGVSDSTLSTIGTPSGVVLPQAISGSALTQDGKPEIVYVGGEYCPYCGVERWAIIIALSHFGTFTGLEYMQSSSTDVNANTPTFTFANASYTSQYIGFVHVEEFSRTGATINPLNSTISGLVTQYDSAGSIPFVDLANTYLVVGVQTDIDIGGQNWTTIANGLNTPTNSVSQQIDGAANTLISAICKIDGGQPASVCSQEYADVTLAYATPASSSLTSSLLISSQSPESRWTG